MNIILVRSPFRSSRQKDLFNKYKDSLLFIGISSFEDFPLPPPNPFLPPSFQPILTLACSLVFCTWRRSQRRCFHRTSSFCCSPSLTLPCRPKAQPCQKSVTSHSLAQTKMSTETVWGGRHLQKNWTFAKEALEVMCSQGITGVLVATKDKQGRKACSIPANCAGKITQTTFLSPRGVFQVREAKQILVCSSSARCFSSRYYAGRMASTVPF